MNEWLIAGIVVVGTLLVGGGGAFIRGLFHRNTPPPKA